MYLAHFKLLKPPFDTPGQNHLSPLKGQEISACRTKKDLANYISERLDQAGCQGTSVFSPTAIRCLQKVAGGQIELVNRLADKSLLAAFIDNKQLVQERHVLAAMRDLEIVYKPAWYQQKKWPVSVSGLGIITLLVISLVIYRNAKQNETPTANGELSELQKQNEAQNQSKKSLLNQRLAESDLWLTQIQANELSIQLFVTADNNDAKLERFLNRAKQLGALDKLYIFSIKQAKKSLYQISYGQYKTQEEAAAALQRMPEKYKSAFKAIVCQIQVKTRHCEVPLKTD